ncbi:hypothetical protein L1987_08868 [Smallanthus sonchifolius]|uniref:Uncharacterized protein n=1 Tax=Smallanthus sonchifolius TaxID=185202 RepID=A0ACB9JLE1_9ASTR|nr:hypothetical protein L1987_08868 [Smallanthus sonchifolius]
MQLRTKYCMTPEAVFEIVGAGSEIPWGFVQPGPVGLILEGPWIGVAICAVISVHHVDGRMEPKYTVTTHIHLGEKHWKILVPVNFMVAESETQLVYYWKIADDLQRIFGSSQKSNFGVSFCVQPEDCNLQVTKFGVRFIRKEFIAAPHSDSTITVGTGIKRYPYFSHGPYIAAFKDDRNLHQHTCKLLNFIFGYGRQQDSLDGIYQITKGVLEINQEFLGRLSIFAREWRGVYCYYVISLGVSVLYRDFIRSLKDINDRWLSVKLALEQIVVKSRADNYNYNEMLQHLNDLEATYSVGFSDSFVTMFLSVCRRTFDFLCYLERDPDEVLAKTSSITIAGVIYMLAAYMGDVEHLKEMEDTTSSSLWQHLLESLRNKMHYFKENGDFIMRAHYNRELKISIFYDNRILLQELMNKMGRSDCFTKENAEEMMNVIDKLQKSIRKVSTIIQDMSSDASQYSHDISKARKHVYIVFWTFKRR